MHNTQLSLMLIILFCFLSICYIVWKVFVGEKKAKVFRKNLKLGDSVSWDSAYHNKGEIVDIDPKGDGNFVKVTSLVPKHIIYPKI